MGRFSAAAACILSRKMCNGIGAATTSTFGRRCVPSFSGHDPVTHACKARPLTVVGWTSLSVIVIVCLHNDDSFRFVLLCDFIHFQVVGCFVINSILTLI